MASSSIFLRESRHFSPDGIGRNLEPKRNSGSNFFISNLAGLILDRPPTFLAAAQFARHLFHLFIISRNFGLVTSIQSVVSGIYIKSENRMWVGKFPSLISQFNF